MNNLFVYCEVTEEGHIADVSLELLSKGRKLADQLHIKVEAIVLAGEDIGVEDEIAAHGADVLHKAVDKRLFPYLTLPHSSIVSGIFREEAPQIALIGATSIGRDISPRIASALKCGLTADCTSLEIGQHYDKKTDTNYTNLLYQIRPAFGGNIIATIINPETKPQMATVREGVMKRETFDKPNKLEVHKVNVDKYIDDADFAVKIIERHIEPQKVNIKGSQIIVAGGYGVGSKENFDLLFDLADVLGGEVGASRAAVDAGFVGHERQIGQTGITVRPKLYIACGISGAVQHRAGMDQSAKIISINTDPHAPINYIADYTVNGTVEDVVPKMIKYFKKNTK